MSANTAPTIAVIDHGAGNLVSIGRGLERANANVVIATEPGEIEGADGVVLPGVGSATAAMRRLVAVGFDSAIRAWDGPLLGICVGMQLFFDRSEEHSEQGDGACLSLFDGEVTQLTNAPLLPHIGWNDVVFDDHPLFAGIATGTPFYFVHSFAAAPGDPEDVIGTTTYGDTFASAVGRGHRYAVQFHPERSSVAGLRVLENFVAICGAARMESDDAA